MTNAIASLLVARLQSQNQILVLAESCTCGCVAAAIGGVPGASKCFAGSAVTYREATKHGWLDVDPQTLAQHTAESRQTTEALARGVLLKTPDATLSAAITGHLGPDAPVEKDGQVFGCIVQRAPTGESVIHQEHRLVQTERTARQREAAQWLIERLVEHCDRSAGWR